MGMLTGASTGESTESSVAHRAAAIDQRRGARPSEEFLQALRQARRPFVVAHVTPDADAVGAVLALSEGLRRIGSSPTAGLTPGRTAAKLRFMFELAPAVPLAETWTAADHDAVIVLDTAGEKRIQIEPKLPPDAGIVVFNIDHHFTNTLFGRHHWVDPDATSTSEMIFRLLGMLDVDLTPAVASLLYAGIYGDTGGFSYPNTTAAVLHAAGDLVRAGADVSRVGEQLCRSQTRSDFELLRRVYDHTTVTPDGRIAYSFLTLQDVAESGCTADDIDDQVSVPRALKGVRLALLFSEAQPGIVRVNLRGEGDTSVVEIAQRFGGGGHRQSAGVRLRGRTVEEAIREVLAAAAEHLDRPGTA